MLRRMFPASLRAARCGNLPLLATCASGLLAGGFVLYGQTTGRQAGVSFEVASIKFNKTSPTEEGGGTSFEIAPNSLTVRNYPFAGILMRAYNISGRYILNPNVLPAQRYDIDAKASHPCGRAELMVMLQNLLADRFKLAMHRETKEISGYVLVVDAGGGPKVRESNAIGGDCTTRAVPDGTLQVRNCAMSFFALGLGDMLGQPVEDKTGLAGTYDFEFLASWELSAVPGQEARVIHAGAPSVPAALKQQLGLRLQPQKVAVAFYNIDHIERLSEN